MAPSRPPIRCVAASALACFILTLGVLHLGDSGLDPRKHVISEYANTGLGWLLTAAVLCWAISLVATARWLTALLRVNAWARVAGGLLVLAAVGLVIATVFHTQAVAGVVPQHVERTAAGRLHDAGTGLATLALFASAGTVGLMCGASSRLGRASLALVLWAVVVQVSLLVAGQEVNGVRQRLLVLGACAWQAALLQMVRPAERSFS